MARDHRPSVKDDKQYERLRKKGESKQKAARIANTSRSGRAGAAGDRAATRTGQSRTCKSAPRRLASEGAPR
jgi:hypothetical protein